MNIVMEDAKKTVSESPQRLHGLPRAQAPADFGRHRERGKRLTPMPQEQDSYIHSRYCRRTSIARNATWISILVPSPSQELQSKLRIMSTSWKPREKYAESPVAIIGGGVLGRRLAIMWASRGGPVSLCEPIAAVREQAAQYFDETVSQVLQVRHKARSIQKSMLS